MSLVRPPDGPRGGHRRLLVTELDRMRRRLGDAPDEWSRDACWRAMEQALEEAGVALDVDVAGAVISQDADDLARLLRGWRDGSEPLCRADYQTLAAALQRFSVECMTRRTDRVEPPGQVPDDVWDLLVSRGLLERLGDGRLCLIGRGRGDDA